MASDDLREETPMPGLSQAVTLKELAPVSFETILVNLSRDSLEYPSLGQLNVAVQKLSLFLSTNVQNKFSGLMKSKIGAYIEMFINMCRDSLKAEGVLGERIIILEEQVKRDTESVRNDRIIDFEKQICTLQGQLGEKRRDYIVLVEGIATAAEKSAAMKVNDEQLVKELEKDKAVLKARLDDANLHFRQHIEQMKEMCQHKFESASDANYVKLQELEVDYGRLYGRYDQLQELYRELEKQYEQKLLEKAEDSGDLDKIRGLEAEVAGLRDRLRDSKENYEKLFGEYGAMLKLTNEVVEDKSKETFASVTKRERSRSMSMRRRGPRLLLLLSSLLVIIGLMILGKG